MAFERLDNRQIVTKGLPRTQAIRLESLKRNHIGKEFVGLGILFEFGCDGWTYWVRTTGFPRLEWASGKALLRYYLDEDAS